MEVKSGYKQTQAGIIPEDWGVRQIIEVCDFIVPGRNKPKRFDGTIPWVTTPDLIDGGTVYESRLGLSVSKNEAKNVGSKVVPAGSVVMSCVGDLGVVARAGCEIVLNQQLHAFIPSASIDGQYLKYAIKEKKSYLESIATKTALPYLNKDNCNSIQLPFPQLSEQRAIATALSDVDALLAKLDVLIAKKRDLKQATMQQLLTGQTRLPGFSGEWEVKRLGALFSFSGGHTASRDQLSDTGYCYLHYGDIHLSEKTFIDVDAEFLEIPKLVVELNKVNTASLLTDGDIVFVDASEDDEGTSKHVVVVNPDGRPYISGLHTIVAKSKNDRINNLFKRYCFQTRSFKEQFRFFAVGTKVSGISKTSVAKVELRFPPSIDEQNAIATVLADMDAELSALEARRDKTRALKLGMMQVLLTGRIRLV